ncbi:hypothetical protein JYG30_06230 [Fibrella sp. USSR17]
MIYLLDDNKDDKRRLSFNVSFVDDSTFDGYLTSISHLSENADLSFLSNAVCLLVHETTEDIDEDGNFKSGITTNAQRLIDDISDRGDKIPLVIFSNGMNGPTEYDYDVRPHFVKAIHKTLLYQHRLFPFLNHYKQTNQVEMRIIAFGENFRAVEAGRYAHYLIESLSVYKHSQLFNLSFIPKLSMLQRFYEFMQPNGDFIKFVNDLEDSSISVGKFVENVSAVIESISENYGKNTHTWHN